MVGMTHNARQTGHLRQLAGMGGSRPYAGLIVLLFGGSFMIDRGVAPMLKRFVVLPLALAGTLWLGGCSSQRQSTAISHYVRGQLDAESGKTQKALAELTAAISQNPNMVLAYEARGDIYRKQGRIHNAIDDYQHAVTLNSKSFHGWYELGVSFQAVHNFQAAVSAYQHSLQVEPKNSNAAMNLAVAYAQTGQPLFGIIYGQRALANGAKSFASLANLGAIYAEAANVNPAYGKQAINYFRSSLELKPHQGAIYLDMAAVYLQGKHYAMASRVLKTAGKLAPSALVQERLGYAYYRMGNLPRARAAYHAALKLNANYPPALNGLGVADMAAALQSESGDPALRRKAVGYWRQSLQLNPDQPMIQKLVKRFSTAAQ
jgi:tetratricopeptide (TPR) repeat protein